MHLFGSDLNFKRLADRAHQSRVKRLIHICLRHSNIILESSRNRCVHLVNDSQRSVTVFHRIYNDPDCEQIIDLIHGFILVDHLFIYTEEMFHSTVDFRLNVRIFHMSGDLIHDLLNELLSLCLSRIDLFHQIIEYFRLRVFQCQVIQLCLYFRNTKPLRDRRVDVHGLFRLFLLLLRPHILQSPHIMQTVCKFNNDNADIFCHSKEHFPKVLRLNIQLIRRIG